MPDRDVTTTVATLGPVPAAARTAPVASGAAPVGSGCFNPGVARMLTHWKEN